MVAKTKSPEMKMTRRTEERFIMKVSDSERLTKRIDCIADREDYENQYTHTIYFDNPEHELPFEVSLRARRYADSYLNGPLNTGEQYKIDDKIELNSSRLLKRSQPMELGSIISANSSLTAVPPNPINSPLIPYMATSYKRDRYLLRGGITVTIDRDIRYYILEDLVPRYMTTEPGTRVELKTANGHNTDMTKMAEIREVLAETNAEATIEKKIAAYNMVCNYLRTKMNRPTPKPEIEIEAKLSLDGNSQYVIHRIKQDFFNGSINGFALAAGFSYTLERGKLYRYISTGNETNARINVGEGFDRTLTVKSKEAIVEDGVGLGCILKRHKSESAVPQSFSGGTLGIIERRRKYIIVERKDTGNTYSI